MSSLPSPLNNMADHVLLGTWTSQSTSDGDGPGPFRRRRGGRAVAGPAGAIVTVTDLADEHALADSLAALQGVPIAAFHLGGHREEDFRHADLVVVNPAVRPDNPFLQIARESAVRVTHARSNCSWTPARRGSSA